MRKLLFFATIVFLITWSQARAEQLWDTLWTQTYGGDNYDEAYSVRQTSDKGYILAGYTRSFGAGSSDAYLLKTDSDGEELWTRTYGGSNNEEAFSVQQTSDGGYIVAGYTSSFGEGNMDIYLIKTYYNGDIIWTRTYGSALDDCAYSVTTTNDGAYIVAGVYNKGMIGPSSEVYLMKIDALGDIIWSKTYTYNDYSWGKAYSVQKTNDGGYILAGDIWRSDVENYDFFLAKVNSDGDAQWTRIYGSDENHEIAKSVQNTNDGGYIIAGYRWGFDDSYYLVKTDPNGEELWTEFGVPDGRAYSVLQTYNEGYIAAGSLANYGAENGVTLMRTDVNGGLLWWASYLHLSHITDDWAYSIQKTNDECYIVAGYNGSYGIGGRDVYLLKFKGDEPVDTCLKASVDIIPDQVCCDNLVPAQWILSVKNCGDTTVPVYAHISMMSDNCATGTPFGFPTITQLTPALAPGQTFTHNHTYLAGFACSRDYNAVALNVKVGPAVGRWISRACDILHLRCPTDYVIRERELIEIAPHWKTEEYWGGWRPDDWPDKPWPPDPPWDSDDPNPDPPWRR